MVNRIASAGSESRPRNIGLPAHPTKWNPIETLHRLDTDIILWNPCDGVHTLSVLTSLAQLDRIRGGKVYTHWQKVEPPTIGDRHD